MADKDIKTPVQEDVEEAKTTAAEQAETSATQPDAAPKRRKVKRTVTHAHIHILATFNNTIVTVADEKGNTLSTASAGASGFRGSKKGTAYAAQVAAEKAITDAKQTYGISKADVLVKGVGLGRDSAVRSLINQNIQIESVRDVTGVPHGGVRPRKPKRN